MMQDCRKMQIWLSMKVSKIRRIWILWEEKNIMWVDFDAGSNCWVLTWQRCCCIEAVAVILAWWHQASSLCSGRQEGRRPVLLLVAKQRLAGRVRGCWLANTQRLVYTSMASKPTLPPPPLSLPPKLTLVEGGEGERLARQVGGNPRSGAWQCGNI